MTELSKGSAQDFVTSVLPLYLGPNVKVRIGSGGKEYTVSKALLCRDSASFSAMFEGDFLESDTQSATLETIKGVVSEQSFEGLLQWIYSGKVKFHFPEPEACISAIIEVSRLADLCHIPKLESQMAQCIKEILTNLQPVEYSASQRSWDNYLPILTAEHIASAAHLPTGHQVRRILVMASVHGFFKGRDFKFTQEMHNYPTFAADLLQEVRAALDTLRVDTNEGVYVSVTDPLGEKEIILHYCD